MTVRRTSGAVSRLSLHVDGLVRAIGPLPHIFAGLVVVALILMLAACATPQPPNPYTQAPPPQHALVAHSPMADLLFGALIFVLF